MFAGYHPDAFWEVCEATEEEVKAVDEAVHVGENVPDTIEEEDEDKKEEVEENVAEEEDSGNEVTRDPEIEQ